MNAYTAAPPTKDSTYVSITGGTLLADGSQAATESSTVRGIGYTEYEAVVFFGTSYRPKAFTGPAAYVDPATFPNGQNGFGGPLQRTGPGYSIGFPFVYNGDTFDRLGISGQGWVGFGKSSDGASAVAVYTSSNENATTLPLANTGVAEGTYKRNRVVAYGLAGGSYASGASLLPYMFQSGYSAYPGATLRIETIGSAPNRVCVVQWENYAISNSGSLDPQFFTFFDFQVRLYETSNKVEVRYGDCRGGFSNAYSQVGLGGTRGGTTGSSPLADFSAWRIDQNVSSFWPAAWNNDFTVAQPIPTPSPFVASTPSAAAPYNNPQGTINNVSTQVPNDLSFVWAPPSCPQQASAFTFTNLDTASVTLNWTGTGTFDYAVSTTNSVGAATITGTVTGNTIAIPGLVRNTTYYAFIRTNCGGGDFSAWTPSLSFTTFDVLNCGATWTDPGGPSAANVSTPYIKTWVIRPTNPGEKVTLSFSAWTQMNWNIPQSSPMFIRDGYGLSAPLVTGGTGIGYTCSGAGCPASQVPSWNVPAGGFLNQPPVITSTAANGCLTVQVYSYGLWVNDGWVANVTCAVPATCFAPTARTLTGTTPHGASFSWTSTSPSVDYIVVANGGTPASPVLASGSSSTGTGSVTGLVANTQYTAFFRGSCSSGTDLSSWGDPGVNFRTKAGCGGTFGLGDPAVPSAGMDSVVTICPDNGGDVVTVDFTDFYRGDRDLHMFVYDGPNTSSYLLQSGQTTAPTGFPVGGYGISGIANLPAQFTSTHSGGCLTFRFAASQVRFNAPGINIQSNVTCAPRPPCAAPGAVALSNIGGTSAIVSWTGAGTNYIIEYGPTGFTPGTDATAGTNGTVVPNAVSGGSISGLSTTTAYDLYVRQVCAGPVYSDNSFRARFTTSMDCSTAQVITCGELVSQAIVSGVSGNAIYQYPNYTNGVCATSGVGVNVERLYRITASVAGTYQVNMPGVPTSGQVNFLTAPVSNGCGVGAFTCIGVTPTSPNWPYGPVAGSLNFSLPAGDHYILMDPALFTDGTQQFQVFCPGLPPCVTAPTYPGDNGTVANTATAIAFSWPASFGATSYDVYFQNALVTTVTTNSVSSASYTGASIAALYGIGTAVTWRVVPKNSFGTATCPTNFSFRVGGNGTANAIPLTSGVPVGANNRTTSGYSSTDAALWGNDVAFSFTASACAASVDLSMCPTAASGQIYSNLKLKRASDNVVIGTSAEGYTSGPSCQQRSAVPVEPGVVYYVIVDAYASLFDFSLTLTENASSVDTDGDGTPDCTDACPENPDLTEEGICGCDVVMDTDGDGIADCIDSCPLLAGEIGSACDPGPGFGNGVIDGNCVCVGQPLDCLGVPGGSTLPGTTCNDGNPATFGDVYGNDCVCAGTPCNGNQAVVSVHTDANGSQTTWQIQDAFAFTVASGGPYTGQNNATVNTTVCLPTTFGSCYSFYIFDSFGDGLCCANGNGYWELKDLSGGVLLRDRFMGTNDGHQSPAAAPAAPGYVLGHQFCLPTGPSNVMPDECGIFTNSLQSKVYCKSIPGVSQYQFEFSDPDAGFRRFIALPRNWVKFSEMQTSPLIPGNTYFTRVRADQGAAGFSDDHFGTGCEMGLSANAAGCTGLIDDSDLPTHSCGATKRFGGSDKIWARPLVNATQYRFRFTNAGEGFTRQIERPSYVCLLNWVTVPLVSGVTYDVQVEALVNGTWTGYCGPICQLTIQNPGSRPDQRITLDVQQNTINLWPNPNTGDRVFLTMDGLDEALQNVQVDIFDLAGQRAMTTQVAVAGGSLNTVLRPDAALTNGVYLVRITAGEHVFTQRMVVQ